MGYYCKLCDYKTNRKSNYEKHLLTNRHVELMNSVDDVVDVNISDKLVKNINAAKYEVMKEKVISRDKLLEEKDKTISILQEQLNKYMSLVGDAGKITGKSMSIMEHLMKHHSNAPPLEQFVNCDIIKSDKTDNEYVELLFYYHRHSILIRHIVECITKVYKKEDPNQQAMWATDTSRLTYIIKNLMRDNTSVWTHDKKGILTCNNIVEPLLSYIRTEITNYISKHNEYFQQKGGLGKIDVITHSENMITAGHIINEIDSGDIKNSVLKDMAPHFYIDRNRLL